MHLQHSSVRSGITFEVSAVELATEKLPEYSSQQSLERLVGAKIETCSGLLEPCIQGVVSNPLVTAAAYAYAQHRPLALGPDVIWLTILQGLSIHIEENWDELHSFVSSSSLQQRLIEVNTEEFPIGSLESPWEEFISEAASTARGAVQDQFAELFELSFSTTGPRERAAIDVTLLAGLRPYLTLFDISSVCGIPAITINGSVDDWRKIRTAVDQLDQYGLDWWTQILRPICDEFINAVNGVPNLEFWKQLFQYEQPLCSDAKLVTGWIGDLFPYFKSKSNTRRNSLSKTVEGPEIIDFPSGIREVNIVVKNESNLRLLGGLVGIAQDAETLTLSPKIGWGVRRDKPLENLIARLSKLPHVQLEFRSPSERFTSLITCPDLIAFYREYESLTIERADHSSELIQFLPKEYWKTDRDDILQVAMLENGQWLGAVNFHSPVEVLLMNSPAGSIYILGDDTTLESEGPVHVIGTSYVQVLERILECVENNQTITFDIIAQLDPSDENARLAFLPTEVN